MTLRKTLLSLGCALAVCTFCTLSFGQAHDEKKPAAKPAEAKPAEGKPADKAAAPSAKPTQEKPAVTATEKPAVKPADKPAADAHKGHDHAAHGDKGHGEGGMDPAMMEAMEKAATPGEFHAHLKPLAGNWETATKWWMDPTQPPAESKGTSTSKWIMDGRFLMDEYTGDMMGQPFKGTGITGYDNVQKKYVNVWVDNMTTSMMTSTGACDGSGKTFTYTGEYADPMTGKMKKNRMVTKILGDDKHLFEIFEAGPDGKEFKSLEVTHTRKK